MSNVETIRAAAVVAGVVVNVEMIIRNFDREGVTYIPSETAGIGDIYANGKFTRPPVGTPPPAHGQSLTYKADVWRRATDAQAAVIDTELQKLDVRRRRMWDDAMYLDHADELVVFFRTMLSQTFGAAEADRILAPSNV